MTYHPNVKDLVFFYVWGYFPETVFHVRVRYRLKSKGLIMLSDTGCSRFSFSGVIDPTPFLKDHAPSTYVEFFFFY